MFTANFASQCFWQILTKQGQSLTLKLHNKYGRVASRNLGTLTVHIEEPVALRTVVDITFRCTNLDNKDFFSRSVCQFSFFPSSCY